MFLCDLDSYSRRSRRQPSLALNQLEQKFHTFLLEVYHRRPSSEGRLSPKKRWEKGGFLPRIVESLEQLDLLLMQEVRIRKVRLTAAPAKPCPTSPRARYGARPELWSEELSVVAFEGYLS